MSQEWNIYRTRFLVRARKLTQAIAFTDALGREHQGKPGDYLVQSSEGLFRIAPREIFEDVYVVLADSASPAIAPYQSFSVPEALPIQGFVEKTALTGNSPS